MIKILWFTRSRKHRVISHWWEGFRKEVSKMADVTLAMIPAEKETKTSLQEQKEYEKLVPLLKDASEINKRFDIIYNESPAAFLDIPWRDVTIPKTILMNDQHGVHVKEYFHRAFYANKFNILVTTYKNALNEFHPDLEAQFKVIWLPFAVDPEIFKDYKLDKKIGCLNIGIINEKIYPLRHKSNIQLKNSPWYKRVERPPERFKGAKWPINNDYAKLINSAKITITDSSVYHYPVLKFFEIPACNSVLCSNYFKELGELGFIPNENMLEVKKTDNIKEIVLKMLKNNNLEKISEAGYKLIHTKHTLQIRAQEFIFNLEKLQ